MSRAARSSLTGAVTEDAMVCWPVLHYRSPVEGGRETTARTGGRIWALTDGCSAADAVPQNKTTQSWQHETS